MAISNRSELEDSIKAWLNREDPSTVDRIPDFITLAENRIFYGDDSLSGLRCRANESFFSWPDIDFEEFRVPVPSDLLEVKSFQLESSPEALTPRSDRAYFSRSEREMTGLARYYTRLKDTTGENYVLWPVNEGDTSALNLYYYANTRLGEEDTATNSVLTEHPGLYLWGALIEAAPFLKFNSELPIWESKFNQVFSGAMANTWASEYAGDTISVGQPYGD